MDLTDWHSQKNIFCLRRKKKHNIFCNHMKNNKTELRVAERTSSVDHVTTPPVYNIILLGYHAVRKIAY